MILHDPVLLGPVGINSCANIVLNQPDAETSSGVQWKSAYNKKDKLNTCVSKYICCIICWLAKFLKTVPTKKYAFINNIVSPVAL